jgi:carbonic anhydrase
MKTTSSRLVLSAAALLAIAGAVGWTATASPDDPTPSAAGKKHAPKQASRPVSRLTPKSASKAATPLHGAAPANDHAPEKEHAAAGSPEPSLDDLFENPPVKKAPGAKSGHAAPGDDAHEDLDADVEVPAPSSYRSAKPIGTKRAAANATADLGEPANADEALSRLQDGNERWASGRTTNPNSNASRRQEAAEGQHPFAAVLTCADSRLPVERVFDQGVGDLFVVRVAGNIAGTNETGTMEYGAEHLSVPLLVVMGHTKCGAVGAAAGEGTPEGALGELVGQVRPAVERAQRLNPDLQSDALIAAAIKENVWHSIFTLLRTSPVLAQRVQSGDLKIVGAVCDIASGKVQWLGEHPWQEELVASFAGKATRGAHAKASRAGDDEQDNSLTPTKPAAKRSGSKSAATRTAKASEHDDPGDH